MSVLVDTNILIRSLQRESPQYAAAAAAILDLNRRDEPLCIVPQVLYEFWTVATRPAGENGLGLTAALAHAEQVKVLSLFTLLPDGPAILPEWQRLVLQHDVKGKNAHDARLVAAMSVHGVRQLLTFNVQDFARYPGLTLIDPRSFTASTQTNP